MSELLIPVDPELAAIAELNAALPSTRFALAAVGTKIPTRDPKPRHFVRVIATGGAQRDLVTDRSLITLEGFSVDETDARDLTALAVAIMQRAGRTGALGGATCFGVEVGGLPSNLPHPTVATHFRFTATVSAALRRTTV